MTPTKNKPVIQSHELRVMKLAQLKPHPKNARDIDPEALDALRQSMRKFGVVEHLVHNERTGFLVGGHQRLRILLEDGIVEEKVVIVDLDEVEEEALRLVLNNPKAQGHFTDQVGAVLDGIEAEREDLFRSLRLDSLRPPEKAPIRHLRGADVHRYGHFFGHHIWPTAEAARRSRRAEESPSVDGRHRRPDRHSALGVVHGIG